MTKLNNHERKLLNDNMHIIKIFINTNYKKIPREFKTELYSQGYLEVCSKIHSYDPEKSAFNTFVYAILTPAIRNYYNRVLLGSVSTTRVDKMTDEQLENKKKKEQLYAEQYSKYLSDLNKWESDKNNQKNNDKPTPPKKQSYNITFIPNNVEYNDEYLSKTNNINPQDYIKSDMLNSINNIINTYNPVKKIFCKKVLLQGESSGQVTTMINNKIQKIASTIEHTLKIIDSIDVDREYIVKKYANSNCEITKEFCRRIASDKNKTIQSVKQELHARVGKYYKDIIINDIKFKLREKK